MARHAELIAQAIRLMDSQSEFARQLEEASGEPVSRQRVWNWLRLGQSVPPALTIHIERLTRGKVLACDFHPRLFTGIRFQ